MLKIKNMDIYYIRGDDDGFSIQPTADDGTEITDFWIQQESNGTDAQKKLLS